MTGDGGEVQGVSPVTAQTRPLPCSSVQLGDAEEEQHSFYRMPEISWDLEISLDASMGNQKPKTFESNARWLDEGGPTAERMGKHAELLRAIAAPGHAMPQLDTKMDLLADNNKVLEGHTADWQDTASAGDNDAGQDLQDAAFRELCSGKPGFMVEESACRISGRRSSESSSWPVRLKSDRDPVAAFSDFCNSLAV
jgi:hypothetical protein